MFQLLRGVTSLPQGVSFVICVLNVANSHVDSGPLGASLSVDCVYVPWWKHWFRIKGDGHRSIFPAFSFPNFSDLLPSKTSEVCRQWWYATKIHWAHHEECLMVRWIYTLFHFLIMAHGEWLELWRHFCFFFFPLMMVADGFIMNLPGGSVKYYPVRKGNVNHSEGFHGVFCEFVHTCDVERSPTHIN